MKDLIIRGTQNFMNIEIPVVLGGFGENKRCISDKTIAEIHNQPEREIRRRITDNINRFKENVDCIDLKQRVGESHTSELLLNMGYAKQSITQAEHIYLLSERGYAKLIKIMDTDLAWEIHDKLIDEYFELREEKENSINLDGISTEMKALIMQDKKLQIVVERVDKLEDTMVINYGQQRVLTKLVNSTVVTALGGKDKPAYKEIGQKVFSECNRDIKDRFLVNSRNDIPKLRFDEACTYIKNWQPCTNTKIMIDDYNAQMCML